MTIPSKSRTYRELWAWLVIGLITLLVFGCLALVVINTGPGFDINGQRTQFRIVTAYTNYPFCPPDIPCPVSAVLSQNHFVVWVERKTINTPGDDIQFQKILDIPLW